MIYFPFSPLPPPRAYKKTSTVEQKKKKCIPSRPLPDRFPIYVHRAIKCEMNTLEALSLYVNIVSVQVCVQYRGGASPKCDNHWSVYLHTNAGYVVQVTVREDSQLEWTQRPNIPVSEIKILGNFATINVPQVTNVATLVFGKSLEKCDPNVSQSKCDCQSRM